MKQGRLRHCLIFDPIPFNGGSKKATCEMMSVCNPDRVRFTIVTADPESWQSHSFYQSHQVKLVTLISLGALARATHGWRFWLKQALFTTNLVWVLLWHRGITRLLAPAHPGTDMPAYLASMIFGLPVIQFIHGNVPQSRSVRFCLIRAHKVFYLRSSHDSLCSAIDANSLSKLHDKRFTAFDNGIRFNDWPSQAQIGEPKLLWCASLLQWKRLDVLAVALRKLGYDEMIPTEICYIKPKQSLMPVCHLPNDLILTTFHEQPDNLDAIRRSCSIFVSTSENEPFGLSILEALAAGLCVLIPSDGAYWDKVLHHDQNCIKYQPTDSDSLLRALLLVARDDERRARIARQGMMVAKHYRAEHCYWPIADYVQFSNPQKVVASGTQEHGSC